MYSRPKKARQIVTWAAVCALWSATTIFAGVSRIIQDKYRRTYENKALFLKIPVYSDRQYIYLRGQEISPEPPPGNIAARFKVGDHVRVLRLDFGGDEIRFRVGAVTGLATSEFVYKFDAPLQEDFPNSAFFDRALGETFTEGLRYADLEEAKRVYVEEQFNRAVGEMAVTAGTNRETVLRSVAPLLPAYQDAQKDVENLRRRGQEQAAQIAQLQSENRKVDTELRNQQAEAGRLRSANQTLQEKIDSSASQLSRLGDDLRNVRGEAQGYQRELANLQRSLNIRVDTGQDLAAQIAALGQAMRKLQQDNAGLTSQSTNFRGEIEKLRTENSRITGDLEESRDSARKLQETVNTLSSKEDSLARQYLDLRRTKEALDNVVNAVEGLRARIVEESHESGVVSGRAHVFMKSVLLGTLEWSLPERLGPNQQGTAAIRFSGESIDYVRVTPEERLLLRSLGERLKVKVKLESSAPAIELRPELGDAAQEVGERERAQWQWKIFNSGAPDSRLRFEIELINKNRDELRLFEHEQLVASASIVRQMRAYLQPIPMVIGAALGLVLVGIAGIFRRTKHPRRPAPPPGPAVRPLDQKRL